MVLRITTVCRVVLSFRALADLLADAPDVGQVEIAVRLAWSADANEGQLRLREWLPGSRGRAQAPRLDGGDNNLADLRFDDGRLAAIDQIDLGLDRIDTDDL